ncbi:MAG TPA: exonuclease domain-containing protein [Candidatus Peribacteraceae bacterium]|nr:exonuclease domain-containing protein [Candidatus Peribacteraceae bacterium]
MKFPPLPLTVLDTETTGFVPKVHQVMEFASMQVKDGVIVDTYEQLFSVREDIPPHIQVLTRILPEMISGKSTFEEKREEVSGHIGSDTLLVGQNLAFDIGMLKGEGIDMTDRPWIDTSLLAALVFPEFHSYSLQYMSAKLKLNHAPAHRALGDVRATLELLGAIWERLLELDADQLKFAKNIMSRSSEGYRMLFDALPDGGGKGATWITPLTRKHDEKEAHSLTLTKPPVGTVQLYEEGLHPGVLQEVINGCSEDASTTHWIAVKNLDHAVRRLNLPANTSVIYPPYQLLNPEAKDNLLTQEHLTADEALLCLKLTWFNPRTREDFAIHGNEKDVWNGKLTCTDTSDAYVSQFNTKAAVYLLDHRQLLSFLADPSHAAHGALKEGAHIIIDDASMLEDTATKAFGHMVSVDSLRAAASGNDALTGLTDLLTIWIEKIRGNEDLHFVTKADEERAETKGLRAQVGDMLASNDLTDKTREQLTELAALLEPVLLKDNIVWTEQRINGSLFLHAAPEYIDILLKTHLYDRYSTTLIVPRGCTETLAEVVPKATKVMSTIDPRRQPCPVTVTFPEDVRVADWLKNPPTGKTIVLASSKRMIEQFYIDHAEALEARGITLICQGLSGGQGRMQAEFTAAEGTAIWIMTPWMYEGTELPEQSADRLIIESMPFDFPGHPVFGRRKDHHRNGFEDYALPRLECRMFRLLRTFCKQRKDGGEVMILDPRLRQKAYGRRMQQYLSQFVEDVEAPAAKDGRSGQMKMF